MRSTTILLLASLWLGTGGPLSAQVDPSVPQFVASDHRDSTHLEVFTAFAKTSRSEGHKLAAASALLRRSRALDVRQAAFDTIAQVIDRLATRDSLHYATEVEGISHMQSDDAAWQLFTWQLFVNDSTYRYGGVLVTDETSTGVFHLDDQAQIKGLENEYELSVDQWYGALYYGVFPFTLKSGRPAWLLFGYDADGFYHRRKVADVLSFSRSGAPLFGAEVFRGKEGQPQATFSRLILDYRVDARVGLRYDEVLGGIVHDRLVTGPPVVRGAPPSRIPDGSYDGYVLDEDSGTWIYREEWFDRVVSPTAPRPEPVLNSSEEATSRDLFGRPKKPRRTDRPARVPR